MSSTYLSLVNKVLVALQEVQLTSDNFADVKGVHAQAKNAVNYSISEMCIRETKWPFHFVEQQSKTLAIGTSFYGFESNYKVADWDSFYVENDGTLATQTYAIKKMNQNDWHRWHKDRDYDNTTSGVGVPDFVFAYGNNKFGLTPVTDKAYTVKYNYWRDHTELSLHSDTTDIPSRYDWVIVNGALYYGDLLKADIQRASKAEEKFEEGLKRMANTLIDRDENISSTVINGGGSRSRASGYVTTT